MQVQPSVVFFEAADSPGHGVQPVRYIISDGPQRHTAAAQLGKPCAFAGEVARYYGFLRQAQELATTAYQISEHQCRPDRLQPLHPDWPRTNTRTRCGFSCHTLHNRFITSLTTQLRGKADSRRGLPCAKNLGRALLYAFLLGSSSRLFRGQELGKKKNLAGDNRLHDGILPSRSTLHDEQLWGQFLQGTDHCSHALRILAAKVKPCPVSEDKL